MRPLLIAVTVLAAAGTALAQPMLAADPARPAADVARDAARHPAEMLAFAHIGPGTRVIDFIPGHGYFTRIFAAAVKPGGAVFADVPSLSAEHDPAGLAEIKAIAANPAYGNVTVTSSLTDPAIKNIDVVWTAQNYHDLHNAPAGMTGAVNRFIYGMLKPGGYYVIVDHAAAPGADVTNTLHRIDPATVKAEVTAAGFVFDGETRVLANPADDHSKIVFDPAIRGHTDQFVYRFRKPS